MPPLSSSEPPEPEFREPGNRIDEMRQVFEAFGLEALSWQKYREAEAGLWKKPKPGGDSSNHPQPEEVVPMEQEEEDFGPEFAP